MTHKPGDIIQCSGPSMPSDLQHTWWIVRAVESDGTITLSLPYTDATCSELYVPRVGMTSGVYRRECLRLIAQEQAAGNKAARFVTEYRPVR
jgi:hypothetical protein